ncbi:MAG: UDP-N-acetylmuramoyl-L-alanyl-D-glutamate--2,6-diaminopimelate ligase [Lagierella massiliensis]|nr:UDP-N-acetylmuramoyl-L-alanyl-D-glutamate--2,6-diaminopimelate ligase [Lagierella massiliensis]
MKINTLLKKLTYIEVTGSVEKSFYHITLDSRQANEKSIFVAIRGFKTDGHKFIEKAIDNGCKIVVHTDSVKKIEGVTYIKVLDSRIALAEISNIFYDNPSKDMKVVAVTGTNGKTTTTFILEHILRKNNRRVASLGTVGLKTEEGINYLGKTTPESKDLQEIFSDLKKKSYEAMVMEVSSHALELKRVHGVQFDYAAFTNLTYEHMELHGTMENYYQAKKKLFLMTNKQNFINIDDEYGKRLYKELKEDFIPAISYGMNGESEINGKILSMDLNSSTFLYEEEGISEELKIPIAGEYNIYNAICAVAIAVRMGVNIKDIKNSLKTFKKPEGRYEVVDNDKGLNLIIDFAHTSDGMESIIKSAKKNFQKNTIVVFGVTGARTPQMQEEIGRVVGEVSDYSIITMDDEVDMPIGEISKNIIKGMKKSNGKFEYIENREKAIEKAIEIATKDDVVLFLGKGNEKFFKKLDGTKTEYDERKAVEKALLNKK